MASERSKVQEDLRFRVLRLLHDNPELSQRDLAQAVGISNGSAHYLLNALLDKGLIKLGNFTAAQDKRRHAYILRAIAFGSALWGMSFQAIENAA